MNTIIIEEDDIEIHWTRELVLEQLDLIYSDDDYILGTAEDWLYSREEFLTELLKEFK